jgi:hypothetical protein
MARRLDDPPLFLAFLIALLIVDIVWAVVSQRLAGAAASWREVIRALIPGSRHNAVQISWAQNNLLFVVLGVGIVLLLSQIDYGRLAEAAIVMAFALTRTYCDYRLSWSFYFPAPHDHV